MFKMEGFPNSNDIIDTKYANMREFIKAAREYSHMKTEEAANVMNRHLQV